MEMTNTEDTSIQDNPETKSPSSEQSEYRVLSTRERVIIMIGIIIGIAFAIVTFKSLNQDTREVSSFLDDIDEGGSHIDDILRQ